MTRKVAVIGAGASGLKAAFDLRDQGHDVTVFEALDRAGGRTLTVSLARQAIDLGAESFEGGKDSPWLEEFRRRQIDPGSLLIGPFDSVWERLYWLLPGHPQGYGVAFDAAGKIYGDLTGSPAYAETRKAIKANIKQARRAYAPLAAGHPDDASLLAVAAADVAAAQGVDLDGPERLLASKIVEFGPFSESIEATAYSAIDRSRHAGAGEDVRPVKGIGTLFEQYAQKLQQQGAQIHYGRPIQRLERAEGARPWLLGGSPRTPPEAFDAVVVTVALPVLASGQLFLVDSEIRDVVAAAMNGIRLGHYLKVGLWWPQAAAALGGNEACRAYAASMDGEQVWQIEKLAGSPVLVAAAAGRYALRLAQLGKEPAIDEAISAVRLAADLRAGQPEAARTMLWSSDAAFGGAYSYSEPHAGLARPRLSRLNSSLREAGCPGLYFAGEAYSLTQYGNLDGAYESAVQAAADCHAYLSSLVG